MVEKKEEIRGYVPSELQRQLRAVVSLRMDKNWTLSDAMTEAIAQELQLFHNNTAHPDTTQTIPPSDRHLKEDVPYCYGIPSE